MGLVKFNVSTGKTGLTSLEGGTGQDLWGFIMRRGLKYNPIDFLLLVLALEVLHRCSSIQITKQEKNSQTAI